LLSFSREARAVVAVERQLRAPQPRKQPQLIRDAMKHLDCGLDGGVPAVHHALQNDFEHFAHRHGSRDCSAHGVLERAVAFRHHILADQHEQPRARVERRPPAQALDRKVEPEPGEMLVEAVTLGHACFESARLQREPGLVCIGAVLVAEIVRGHRNGPL
jgi:hypothetical protein